MDTVKCTHNRQVSISITYIVILCYFYGCKDSQHVRHDPGLISEYVPLLEWGLNLNSKYNVIVKNLNMSNIILLRYAIKLRNQTTQDYFWFIEKLFTAETTSYRWIFYENTYITIYTKHVKEEKVLTTWHARRNAQAADILSPVGCCCQVNTAPKIWSQNYIRTRHDCVSFRRNF